jgi:hypothetical protein
MFRFDLLGGFGVTDIASKSLIEPKLSLNFVTDLSSFKIDGYLD